MGAIGLAALIANLVTAVSQAGSGLIALQPEHDSGCDGGCGHEGVVAMVVPGVDASPTLESERTALRRPFAMAAAVTDELASAGMMDGPQRVEAAV